MFWVWLGQVTLKDSKGEVFAEVNKDDAAGTVSKYTLHSQYTVRMSECRNWTKLAVPWQELVSFAQMLKNEPSRGIQIDQEPSLG